MKVLFVTNLPSPYRVDFFNELGKRCELTVAFERESASDRDSRWKSKEATSYRELFLPLTPVGADRAKGSAVKKLVQENRYDFLIFTNYVSPATMKAIFYCKREKIPYCIEYDGGFYKRDNILKKWIKHPILKGASYHFTTCEEHIRYLEDVGIPRSRIFKYPFTSLWQSDLLSQSLTPEKKQAYKKKLGIPESRVVLSVGRFIPVKGYDVLLQAADRLPRDIGFYLVGGTPTEEYLQMREDLGLTNFHFVDFMSKEELRNWYCAADLFVLPTRSDIWGLVVNESMACGLPVVTTDRCIAGLELVKNNENGFIVPTDDAVALANAIVSVLGNAEDMGRRSLDRIGEYTIEAMAQRHEHLFAELSGQSENTTPNT